jgi:hypothetical protein
VIDIRTDKGKQHLQLKPFLNKELDREFNSLVKRSDWIKKVHKIMNTIKANGMYSTKEMNLDLENMDLMNIPPEEKKVLRMGWDFRIEQTKQLCIDLEVFINKCKEVER